jgi:uncharacterized integral membrane protein
MRRIKLVFIAILLILIAIIILQNTESVETQLLFYTLTMPRALLLLCTALLGFIVGLFSAVQIGPKR